MPCSRIKWIRRPGVARSEPRWRFGLKVFRTGDRFWNFDRRAGRLIVLDNVQCRLSPGGIGHEEIVSEA